MPQFCRLEPKYKQDSIDDVRLAIAIGSYNTVEVSMEGSYDVLSEVGLEIDHFELMYDHFLITVLLL